MILPIYTTQPLGTIHTESGQTFTITFGLDQSMVDQFTQRSGDRSDEELQRFTSDYKRIALGGYETWYAKERYPFALCDTKGTLAGIIWFGPKEFPEIVQGHAPQTHNPWDTFAIRLYSPYRGQRLAFPFAEFVFTAYEEIMPGRSIWLDTQKENTGAIRLYEKLGFSFCGQKADADGSESDRVVMIRI